MVVLFWLCLAAGDGLLPHFYDSSEVTEKNIYANLLTRCDDACIITPYLSITVIGEPMASPNNLFVKLAILQGLQHRGGGGTRSTCSPCSDPNSTDKGTHLVFGLLKLLKPKAHFTN